MKRNEARKWNAFVYGRREYNDQCRKCVRDCKQSYHADLAQCRNFLSKRSKAGEKYMQIDSTYKCRRQARKPFGGFAKGSIGLGFADAFTASKTAIIDPKNDTIIGKFKQMRKAKRISTAYSATMHTATLSLLKLLGHASVTITYNTYIHLYGDGLEEMRAIVG